MKDKIIKKLYKNKKLKDGIRKKNQNTKRNQITNKKEKKKSILAKRKPNVFEPCLISFCFFKGTNNMLLTLFLFPFL